MPSKVIPSGYEFIKFEVKERARVFKGEIKKERASRGCCIQVT